LLSLYLIVSRLDLKPFVVGNGGMPVSILQYADDTLCIGDATVENLWVIKSVLRGFEMASGLKVNFWKSCIMGVNVPQDFLTMASDFLNCRIGRFPFKYLGLPVGANPRLATTWSPLLDAIKKRLGSWGNRHVSLGGRIVLLNAVLNAIPIFFLSYMKMPMKVWREVVRIQRNFLWGGLSKKTSICWVKWEDVCKPKREGGLGVRNMRTVNLSLLAKWRWRLLLEGEDLWREVIKAKYGDIAVGNAELDVTVFGNICSNWWKDLCNLDKDEGWFRQVAIRKVGSGNKTKFWKDVWIDGQTLQDRFPRLFGSSVQQNEVIHNMGRWEDGIWRWELGWRRHFFVWENEQLIELRGVLDNITLSEAGDSWIWRPNVGEGFSVKSLYVWLDVLLVPREVVTSLEAFSFRTIWKGAVPSKVSALVWQLFLNRIPTKDNLRRRHILSNDESDCVMCTGSTETATHLFMHCDFAAQIWYCVCRWLGMEIVLPPDPMMLYGMMLHSGKNKRLKKGFSTVWLTVIWVVWKMRNERVFNNGNGAVADAMDLIQRLSWQWFLNNSAKRSCLLYEWIWDPGDCMLR
jgi:hypothetical protein